MSEPITCIDSLTFETGAPHVDVNILTFSLPSGFTEPFTGKCLSKVNRQTGILQHGVNYTRYTTSQELDPIVRNLRWKNYDTLKAIGDNVKELSSLIYDSIPQGAKKIIINYSGDFYSQEYMEAWIEVADKLPEIEFYTKTTSIGYWEILSELIPANMKVVGDIDSLQYLKLRDNKFQYVKTVFSAKEASEYGLEVDRNNRLFLGSDDPYAELLLGMQAPGTPALASVLENKTGCVDTYGMSFEEFCEAMAD